MLSDLRQSKLWELLYPIRAYIVVLLAVSVGFNLLLLTPPMYMLSVFDRAVGSRSESTLLMLTLIMIVLMAGMGALDWTRAQFTARASAKMYRLLSEPIFNVGFKQAVYSPFETGYTKALQDLHGLKQYIGSSGILAWIDVVFSPMFLFVMFLFHPYLGWLAVFGLLGVVALALLNERFNAAAVKEADGAYAASSSYAQRNFDNAEVIEAMGIIDNVRARWANNAHKSLGLQVQAGENAGTLTAVSKAFRLMLQSSAIGMGALLVIRQEMSPGMMIAGSILISRILAPIEQLVGGWSNFALARGQLSRLIDIFENMPANPIKTQLPAPRGNVSVEKAVVCAPGSKDPIIKGLSFSLQAGTHLGIVGPSGAGKSTLARALLGLWPCQQGSIRLDEADIFQWDRVDLGPYIGYLPQDMELLDGSISDNIARLGEWESQDVVEAAQLADVHDLILRLPKGYDTVIGTRTGVLSGGQLQRIGLARALYKRPRYVILDEPNTNLDEAGEQALIRAIKRLKAMGTTLIVVAHSTRILAHLDVIMVLREGRLSDFGKAGKILADYEKSENREAGQQLTERRRPTRAEILPEPTVAPESVKEPKAAPAPTDAEYSASEQGAADASVQESQSDDDTGPAKTARKKPAGRKGRRGKNKRGR